MSFERLRSFLNERKWYDFTELIMEMIHNNADSNELASIVELFRGCVQRIHPISISSTISVLIFKVEPQEALNLLDSSISAIVSSSINKNDDYNQEMTSLKMYKCMMSILLGDFEGIETQIIEWKTSRLSDSNFSLLHLIAGKFYEAVGNIEASQDYYLSHARLTKAVVDIDKLLKLSILSKTFFDFSSIAVFKEFHLLGNSNLKLLFSYFQEGDLSKVNESQIMEVLGVDNIEYIRDKIYLINIIMICFKAEQKYVYFDVFLSNLAISEPDLLNLLLKALGINVITGWIDSEQRILFFDRVIPRALNGEELHKMKCKFTEWKDRIGKVIKAIEEAY